MKKFILYESRAVDFTANAKVNQDIVEILRGIGFSPLCLRRFVLPIRGTQRLLSFCWRIYANLALLFIPKGSVVLIQYPNSCIKCERYALRFLGKVAQKTKLILLVQDLDMPRFQGDVATSDGDELIVRLAMISHKVIVHNEVMRGWFSARNIDCNKMVELETFDYLATTGLAMANFSRVVTVAGNLSPRKAAYAMCLKEISGVQWRLFSPYFDKATMGGVNIEYAGVCAAEEFPKLLNSGFGLVWDGDSIDSCAGNAGQYTLVVSPHKFALYLASGLPVIVSKDAAIASFVSRNDLGIAVKSLRDLPEELALLSTDRYRQLATNALAMAHKLRDGYFTKHAVSQALGGEFV